MTTFAKLRSGAWGIRSTSPLTPGERVEVRRRDGSRSAVTVDRVVWAGGGVWLAAIVPEPRRDSAKPVYADPTAAALSEAACGAAAFELPTADRY